MAQQLDARLLGVTSAAGHDDPRVAFALGAQRAVEVVVEELIQMIERLG